MKPTKQSLLDSFLHREAQATRSKAAISSKAFLVLLLHKVASLLAIMLGAVLFKMSITRLQMVMHWRSTAHVACELGMVFKEQLRYLQTLTNKMGGRKVVFV